MAVFAFTTFRDVKRNDVITGFQVFDTGTTFDHFTSSLVTKHAGKSALGIIS
jgi:hypothetical protein